MSYDYFSLNGELLPAAQAAVPLSNIEYSYGYGVYETIRVSKGKAYFLEQHCERLLNSAKIISLEHNLNCNKVAIYVREVVDKNQAEACNVKILLIGGPTAEQASLYILCLNPLFPARKLYKEGVACVTYHYERDFPGAKTLNMLPSYLAYKKAKQAGAYEALLVDNDGCIREGTRTNFYALKGRTIVSPPEDKILPGVTRANVLKVAKEKGFDLVEQDLKLDEIGDYDSLFLTSTSSKIMPIGQIDGTKIGAPAPALLELMSAFDDYLASL